MFDSLGLFQISIMCFLSMLVVYVIFTMEKLFIPISLVFNFKHAIALAFDSGSAARRLNRARQTWLPKAPLEAVRKKIHKSNYFCRIASIFYYLL